MTYDESLDIVLSQAYIATHPLHRDFSSALHKKYKEYFTFPIFDDIDETFLTLLCFFSSCRLPLSSLKGKKILVIGYGDGSEVAVLSLLGAQVYGIEQHMHLYEEAKRRFHEIAECFGFAEAYTYMQLTDKTYDIVLMRDLNPLANGSEIIPIIVSVLTRSGIGIVTWDALYRESEAVSLFAPKQGMYVNLELKLLLRALYIYWCIKPHMRMRFCYRVLPIKVV